MRKITLILKIKMTVEEAENKIGITEGSHRKPGNRSPGAYPFIVYGSGNDPARDGVNESIHEIMITLKP